MKCKLAVLFAGFLLSMPLVASGQDSSVCLNMNATMNIVAHEDDDILFMSPDILHDIRSGLCVRTVFVTAGDDNENIDYVEAREAGARDAYAQMANQPSKWEPSSQVVAGHVIRTLFLHSSRISIIFLRLPDGEFTGDGFLKNSNQSLKKLIRGEIPFVESVDGAERYSLTSLQKVLTTLVVDFEPNTVRVQDIRPYIADHSDHKAVAALVKRIEYRRPHTVVSYVDYLTIFDRPNLAVLDAIEKEEVFRSYAAHDFKIGCFSCDNNPYFYWVKRQYIVSRTRATGADGRWIRPSHPAAPRFRPNATRRAWNLDRTND